MTGSVKGKSVHFDDRYLHVELDDGRVISTPIAWYPELQSATMRELSHYTFICRGTGIEWPDIGYHLSIESMFAVDSIRKVA
ncbi:DUF2442 domain-containing protein [uncultured Thiocystis sp.]|jgi:hypothetical protein|uniref:DUF2442 domain-containing protein n=1 Tax=uncultured Thiocystis sp. TaxID=1202134 RepID=UPI0025D0B44C|nr:DUF2442 domain-containing protein [uncultured Thiocystis sp.]